MLSGKISNLIFSPGTEVRNLPQKTEVANMSENDALKALEARVARLEAAHAQPAASPHIPIYADPPAPPWWGGGCGYRPPVRGPIGDPAPIDYSRIYGDPAPWPIYGGGGYRPPVHWPIGDPAPIDYSRIYADPGPWPVYGGGGYRPPVHWPVGDPAPVDYSRLPAEQLESTLHSINAQKARLASAEEQVTAQLAKLKEKK